MARTVEDCALLLQAIAGPDASDPYSAGEQPDNYTSKLGMSVAGKRIGVPRDFVNSAANEEVRAAFDEAVEVFKKLGATVVDIDSTGFANARNACTLILLMEGSSYHDVRLKEDPSVFGSGVRNRMREGFFLSSGDYLAAQKARGVYNAQMAAAMADLDAVILPAGTAPPASFASLNVAAPPAAPSFTMPFNTSGLPAITLGMGFSKNGLPMGLQIAGHAFEETEVFGIASAFEAATPWHTMFPDVE
jgi:aspartyl-tRNA(Asn)/glutamyl-tRNA(Gln) amidotransferase subunit A